jgi:hypothetical protein
MIVSVVYTLGALVSVFVPGKQITLLSSCPEIWQRS